MHASTPASSAQLPPATLGVLGGGQLGRMLVHAAQRMGYGTVVLDPDAHCPAGQAAQRHIVAAYDDADGWQQLLHACDGITTEFENVPAAALDYLAQHTPVSPPAPAVAKAQNRLHEKQHFDHCQVPCAPYRALHHATDALALPPELFPAIVKTARMGYDGKGQATVADAQQALALRVAELEATDRDQGRHCAGQRREILEELRREICAILTSALKDTKLEAAEERATVTTALALHTQALQAIEKDIKAIFRRLDRRHETTCVAHGRREDDHDD